jgi:hypothetical protein
MALPDFLAKVPSGIIKQVDPGLANVHRIIPYKEINGPNRLCVAVPWGMSSFQHRQLEVAYAFATREREDKKKTIWVDEEISPEQMDEALEKYYP